VGDSEIRFRLALPDEPDVDETRNSMVRRGTPVNGHQRDPNRTISVTEFLLQSRAMRVLSNATASLLVHHPFSVLSNRILEIWYSRPCQPISPPSCCSTNESHEPVLKAGRDRQGRPVEQRISQSIVHKAIEGQAAVMAGDAFDDLNLRQQPSLANEPNPPRDLCPPLVSTGRANRCGSSACSTPMHGSDRPLFREADLEMLTVLANTAAAKIETARLLEAGLHQRRMQEGLRVAAEIQASLLPRSPAQVPGTIWQAEPNRAKPWAAIITTSPMTEACCTWRWGTWLARAWARPCSWSNCAPQCARIGSRGRWLRPRPESTATFISTFPLTGTRPSFSAPQHDLWVRIGADDEGWETRNRRVT